MWVMSSGVDFTRNNELFHKLQYDWYWVVVDVFTQSDK